MLTRSSGRLFFSIISMQFVNRVQCAGLTRQINPDTTIFDSPVSPCELMATLQVVLYAQQLKAKCAIKVVCGAITGLSLKLACYDINVDGGDSESAD